MKKKGKKLISIALTVAMIAGLTACGKGNGGNGNGGSSAADASLAKQYVFKEQALDLNMDSDNMNIDLLTRKGDTIYLLFETYDYSDNGSQSCYNEAGRYRHRHRRTAYVEGRRGSGDSGTCTGR